MVTCIATAVLAAVVSTSAILQKNQQLRDKQREADEVFDYLNIALSPAAIHAIDKYENGQSSNGYYELRTLAGLGTYIADPATPITVEPLVDNAVGHLQGRFTDRPLVKMNFLRTWGLLYLGTGSGPKAIATLHQLSDLSTTTLGSDHPQTTLAMAHLAAAYQSSGQHAEAAAINRKILEFRTHRLGGHHEDTIGAMTNLGSNLRLLTQPDEASRLLEKSLETSKQYLPPQHPATLHAANALGVFYFGAIFADAYKEPGKTGRMNLNLPDCSSCWPRHCSIKRNSRKRKRRVWSPFLFCNEILGEHWIVFNTKSVLGAAIHGQLNGQPDRFEECEQLLTDGYMGLKAARATTLEL